MPDRCSRALAAINACRGRVLETQLGGGRVLAVVDHAGVARRRSGLEEHQPEPRARGSSGQTSYRPRGGAPRPRRCGRAARPAMRDTQAARRPEPRQQAGDIELAAADPDLEQRAPGRAAARRAATAAAASLPASGSRSSGLSARLSDIGPCVALTRAGRRRRRSPARRRTTPRRCTERR